MLNRHDGRPDPEMRTAGFQLLVDYCPEDVTPEQMSLKLNDSLAWVEGTTNIRTSYMGDLTNDEKTKSAGLSPRT